MRKFTSLLLASIVGFGTTFNSYAAVLHTIKNEEVITKGAKLISEQKLTDQGWLDVYTLKIDLNEDNVTLKPIEPNVLGARDTILNMAKNKGALAAINSDFFGLQSTTPSFGPVIEEGKLVHGYYDAKMGVGPSMNMATFLLANKNQVLMDYFNIVLELYANGTKVSDISGHNNIGAGVGIPIILDNKFYTDNAKAIGKAKDVYTIAVQYDRVISQSTANQLVPMPENGYLIVMNGDMAPIIFPNMPVGALVEVRQEVKLKEISGPAISDIQIGIGGGGLLMKNGEEYMGPSDKVSPNSKNPRSVVATTNTPNEVLLIGIDGRGTSVGLNHKELVAMLKSYGVKDAMYLDGGGSTTVVARNEGKTEVTVQNTPSEGTQRKVVNGIGVFSTNPIGSLNNLYIESTRNRSFIGEPIQYTVRGTDENNNPVTIPQEKITFSVEGITGVWNGLSFTPESEGQGLVTAIVDGIEVATELHVEKEPVGIRVEPSNVQIAVNGSQSVRVFGIDTEGYKIPLSINKIVWDSNNGTVTGNADKIIAQGKTIATLKATYQNSSAKVGVIVGDTVVPLESFEQSKAKWAGNTSETKGKVEVSKDVKYHGKQSVKMTYTFNKSKNKQVAYTVLEKPLTIPADANAINIWVNGQKQGDILKAILIDADGKPQYIKLTDSINFEGWRYITAQLPADIKLPAKLTKIYAYTNSVEQKRTSSVYFDHISITRGHKDRTGISVRDDYRLDSMYKESLEAPTGSDYVVNAIGPTNLNSMVNSPEAIAKMGNKLSQNASIILQATPNNAKMNLKPTTYTYQNKFEQMHYQDMQIIMVGTNQGGVRKNDITQWGRVKQALEGSPSRHVILMMSQNPLTQFSDAREGKAFHDYLKAFKETSNKNVVVVTPGGVQPEVRIEDGIRYIRINGIGTVSDNLKDARFVKFKVNGENLYYSFEGVQ